MSGPMAAYYGDDFAWEPFKEIIRTLYLVKDRTLEEVMTEMKNSHGFRATKSQYELHFKKWDFRKNWTKDEWNVIVHKVKKRKRNNLDSEVYIFGAPMNPKKVKKAISRYGSTSVNPHRVPSPQTPDGITIRTPVLESAVLCTKRMSPTTITIMPMGPGHVSTVIYSLPFMQCCAKVDIEAKFYLSGLGGEISGSDAKVRDLSASIVRSFGKGLMENDLPKAFTHVMQAVMPESMLGSLSANLQMIVSQDRPSTVADLVKLTTFILSNKITGSDFILERHIYGWIEHHLDMQLLEYLLSIPGPTTESLAEQLFFLAISYGNVPVIKRLLHYGLGSKGFVSSNSWGTPERALRDALMSENPEVVRILLDAGAHVHVGEFSFCPCLERMILWSDGFDHPTIIQIVQALLRAGAHINPSSGSPLFAAVEACFPKLVSVLLSAEADPNYLGFAGEGDFETTPLLLAMQGVGDVCNVISIVRQLLQAGADPRCTIRMSNLDLSCAGFDDMDEDGDDDLSDVDDHVNEDGDDDMNEDGDDGVDEKIYHEVTALQLSLCYGSVELIQILLDAGAQITDSAFVAAVERDRLDMVRILLEYGARISQSVIRAAARKVQSEVIWLLLDNTSNDIRKIGQRCLLIAAIRHGKTDMIYKFFNCEPLERCDMPELVRAMEATVRRGDITVLRLLLEDDSPHRDVVIGSLGCSLCLAILKGWNDITELLLAAGLRIDSTGCDAKRNPLLSAITQRDANLSRRLLAAGAEVNMKIRVGEAYQWFTVLPAAVAWDRCPLIQEIIDHGAKIDAPKCKGGKTALTVAVERRDLTTVSFLIDAGADVNASVANLSGHTALAAAVRNDDIYMVRYLLAHSADSDEWSLLAAESGSLDMMELLLNARVTRSRRILPGFGSRSLQAAVLSSNADMIKLLLSYGADANAITRPDRGQIDHIKRDIDVESAFGTALRVDESQDSWIVRMFLDHNITNLNKIVRLISHSAGQYTDETAILVAIRLERVGLIQMLISAGADVNLKLIGSFERTPLQLAVEQGDMSLTKLLLENGADVNSPPFDRYGATALQFAAMHGYLGIALVLLEKGADVNASPAD